MRGSTALITAHGGRHDRHLSRSLRSFASRWCVYVTGRDRGSRDAASTLRGEHRIEPSGVEACCPRQVEVASQELLAAVGNVGQALPVWTEKAGRGFLEAHCVVDAG